MQWRGQRRWKSWLIGIAKNKGVSVYLEGKSKSFAWNSEERGASCFCFATAH